MSKAGFHHRSVMHGESISALAIESDGSYIDATFGRGGHAASILESLGPDGRLLVIDKDHEAIALARSLYEDDPRVHIYHGSFANLSDAAREAGMFGKVNGILMDLGVSSPQLDDAERGFSFLRDGPLDMRMDKRSSPSAEEWVNTVDEQTLASVIREYGEERYAKRIARTICEARQKARITRTKVLADLIASHCPAYERNKHPATRTFQALRIFINGELDDLPCALNQSLDCLSIAGRIVAISFHSLEDRIVKRFIQTHSQLPVLSKRLPVPESAYGSIRLKSLGKKKPSTTEVDENVRSRSAILRVAEKIA